MDLVISVFSGAEYRERILENSLKDNRKVTKKSRFEQGCIFSFVSFIFHEMRLR